MPGRYFSTSPVRDDATNNFLTSQVANPFAGLLPGTNINGANVARSQLLRPYPQFTSITALETIGTSDYTSFQGRIERRMANGFTVQVAYTWSKTMTETGYLNPFDTELERVIGPFDRTHVFVTSGIVELPFGRGRHWGRTGAGSPRACSAAGRCRICSRRRAARRSGSATSSSRPARRSMTCRCPAIGDENKWFNVDAFNRVTAQQLVSNVRTQPTRFDEVRGPGYALLDLGFLKNVNLGSRMRAQFRAEVYNALNRANLGGPNTTLTNTALRHHHRAERPAAAAAAGGEVELLGGVTRQERSQRRHDNGDPETPQGKLGSICFHLGRSSESR